MHSPAPGSAASFGGRAERESPELWMEVLRPAVTWMFGFIDMQFRQLEHEVTEELLAEHQDALLNVCQRVGGALRERGGGGLSTCIWRALVALLTHFSNRADPLFTKLRDAEKEIVTLRATVARQEAEQASFVQQLEGLQADVTRLKSERARSPSGRT